MQMFELWSLAFIRIKSKRKINVLDFISPTLQSTFMRYSIKTRDSQMRGRSAISWRSQQSFGSRAMLKIHVKIILRIYITCSTRLRQKLYDSVIEFFHFISEWLPDFSQAHFEVADIKAPKIPGIESKHPRYISIVINMPDSVPIRGEKKDRRKDINSTIRIILLIYGHEVTPSIDLS